MPEPRAQPHAAPTPAPTPDPVLVERMFARVARRYDLANHLLSAGLDLAWRRAAVRCAEPEPGEGALDVCAGTGDLALALARQGARVTAADFCRPMLAQAPRKAARDGVVPLPRFVVADALALPFASGAFDLATVAFGIRNVHDPLAGLRELRRVTRQGGRVVVLEFCTPRSLLRAPYLFYFRRVLPRLGRWISGDRGGAYDYLPASVLAFPERDAFLDLMRQAGLREPRARILSGGIAALYRGEV